MIRSILVSTFILNFFLVVPPAAPVCVAQGIADKGATVTELSARDLLLHVRWLADDAREGREVGTPGNDTVALYIEQAFTRHGLLPAGAAGYMQDLNFNRRTNCSNTR